MDLLTVVRPEKRVFPETAQSPPYPFTPLPPTLRPGTSPHHLNKSDISSPGVDVIPLEWRWTAPGVYFRSSADPTSRAQGRDGRGIFAGVGSAGVDDA